MSDYGENIGERLDRHRVLKSRVESLLNIIENSPADTVKADDAEFRVIEELRRMGNEVLHDWASEKESAAAEECRKYNGNIIGHGKKNCTGIRHSAQ